MNEKGQRLWVDVWLEHGLVNGRPSWSWQLYWGDPKTGEEIEHILESDEPIRTRRQAIKDAHAAMDRFYKETTRCSS